LTWIYQLDTLINVNLCPSKEAIHMSPTKTKPQNAYQRVQEIIRRRIKDGEWMPGTKIPPERELEKEFSLNRMTISKGLLNLANEGLLVRRRGQGTFVAKLDDPIRSAIRLVKFLSPIPNESCMIPRPGILEGLHDALAAKGYHVGVDFYRTAGDLVTLLQRDQDEYHTGLVVWQEPDDAVTAELVNLQAKGLPFVLVDTYPEHLDADIVCTCNTEGSRMAVRYFQTLGHKRIVYITRKVDRPSLDDRVSGFVSGLILGDLDVTANSVVKLQGGQYQGLDEIPAVVASLLSQPNRPTALLVSHEDLALRITDCLNAAGLTVPRDMSIISNDNFDTSHSGVPLTTIVQDLYAMGKAAGDILLERMRHQGSNRPVNVALHPKLIERQSVAAPYKK